MHAVCIPSAPRSARYLESVISIDELSPATLADNLVSSSSPTPEKESQAVRPSPARAPPPIPKVHSSLSSSSELSMNASLVGDRSEALQDTTVLSDLTDEIQRVEARLAVIREEEARLAPLRNPSDVHKGHDQSPPTVGKLSKMQNSVQKGGSLSQPFVNVSQGNYIPSIEYPCNTLSKGSKMRGEGQQTTSGAEEVPTEFIEFTTPSQAKVPSYQDASIHNCEVIHMNSVSDPLQEKHTVVNETTRRTRGAKGIAAHLARTSTSSSSLHAEQQWCEPAQLFGDGGKSVDHAASEDMLSRRRSAKESVVFSLASFLEPIQTVEIEIAQGVYEKLDIFTGDNVTDVAKKFILKHQLDMERALEPLCSFLSNFMISPSCTNAPVPSESVSEKTSPFSNNVIRPLNKKIEKPRVSSYKRCSTNGATFEAPVKHEDNSESKCATIISNKRRASSSQSLPGSTKGMQKQSTNVVSAATPPVVTKMLVFNAEERKASGSRQPAQSSEKKKVTKQRGWHVSLSRSTNAIGGSCNEDLSHADPLCMLSRTEKGREVTSSSARVYSSSKKAQQCHPSSLSASGDTGVKQSAALRSTSTPRSRSRSNHATAVKTSRGTSEVEGRATGPVSRCHSAETRRVLPNQERVRVSHDTDRDALPTFKPSLAPHSIALAARDTARQEGPAYARLHARTPKLSRPSTTAAPRRRSASAERRSSVASKEQPGARLYNDAVDLQRRMRERRASAERIREEAERHSLRPGPHINNNAQWLRSSGERNSGGIKTTWPRCAALPRREPEVKCSEARDLEACTFAPKVNPASVRMFNMVVRSHSAPRVESNDEVTGGNLIVRQNSVPPTRSHSRDNGASGGNEMRVEDRLLQLDHRRRKRLDDERHFRETVDPATGQQLFSPFLGR